MKKLYYCYKANFEYYYYKGIFELRDKLAHWVKHTSMLTLNQILHKCAKNTF